MSTRPARVRCGFTLVELVMAIAVMGIGLAGAIAIFAATARHSADPMIQEQAQLIAEAYLDEILIKRFYDPNTNIVCTGTTAGETRLTYDNVCDYNGLNEAPTNQFGTAIAGLSAYTVKVTVTTAGVSITGVAPGPTNVTIDNTGATRILQVDVTVTGPGNIGVILTGYRTNYQCNLAGDAECKAL
jgi:MSHA pilin protein MshD